MVYDKDVLKFRIISGDNSLIKEVIDKYNKTYKAEFSVLKFEDLDGVTFADVQLINPKSHHIFDLGRSFGAMMQIKRSKGEIEW